MGKYMTYKQAMNPKEGWAHATGDSLVTHAATALANKHCLNPKAVFNWAKKRCPDLYERYLELGTKLHPPDTRILTSVLNDLLLSNEPEFAYGN